VREPADRETRLMKPTEKFKIDAHERAQRKSFIELARENVARLREFGIREEI